MLELLKWFNIFGSNGSRDMNNEERWQLFIDELRAYVEEHHLFPDKHTRLSHKIKYTRKKINEGTLEEWKRVMFEEIAEMRDLSIHTGGRRPKDINS